MEKLGQLRARDDWDLIVVDTPPSRGPRWTSWTPRSGSVRSWTASSSGC